MYNLGLDLLAQAGVQEKRSRAPLDLRLKHNEVWLLTFEAGSLVQAAPEDVRVRASYREQGGQSSRSYYITPWVYFSDELTISVLTPGVDADGEVVFEGETQNATSTAKLTLSITKGISTAGVSVGSKITFFRPSIRLLYAEDTPVTSADPAVVVPAGQTWLVHSALGSLLASGVAGARQISLTARRLSRAHPASWPAAARDWIGRGGPTLLTVNAGLYGVVCVEEGLQTQVGVPPATEHYMWSEYMVFRGGDTIAFTWTVKDTGDRAALSIEYERLF